MSTGRAFWLVMFLAPALGLPGCDLVGQVGGTGELVGEPPPRTPTIVNGQNYNGHPAVGSLLIDNQPGCTATLVGKRTLVSAAHCIMPNKSYAFTTGGQTFQVTKIVSHPSYSGTKQLGVYDVAVLLLASGPPQQPIPIATAKPQLALPVTLIGFGVTGEKLKDGGTKRRGFNTIAQVDNQSFTINSSGPQNSLSCYGDSGGPALAKVNGQEIQVGVVSGSYKGCGVDSIFSRVDVTASWICQQAQNDVVLAGSSTCATLPGGNTPPGGGGNPPPPPPPPGGGSNPSQGDYGKACTQPNDCLSQICATSPTGGQSCTYSCTTDGNCPSGSACFATNYPNLSVCGQTNGGSPPPPPPPGGGTPPPPPPGGSFPGGGSVGGFGATCQSGYGCYSGLCIVSQGSGAFCSQQCFSAYCCPGGAKCVPSSYPGLYVCVP
jgi:hypothetical protein